MFVLPVDIILASCLSARSYVKLGSTVTVSGLSSFGSLASVSVIGCSTFGSLLSVREFVRFGNSISASQGTRPSVGLSVRAQTQLGSPLSVVDCVRVLGELSVF